ncbi:MAG TPA: HlyD family efflux transporter periplasmic adaptor subunit [Kaistiaceae bacterium]|nr:HlyD family efflux transporter periplasmic adaptor subunit [Kaistiaceae bacterium]
MRALRKRPRPDNLVSQQRKATNSVGRIVYLGLVAALLVAVMNFLFGDMVFLRADGLVLRDRTSLAATYLAQVIDVEVKAGDAVREGEVVLRVQSGDMLERLAELSANRARIASQLVDFKVRLETSRQLVPLAGRREAETSRLIADFDSLSDRSLISSARYEEALLAQFDAQHDYVKLSTESSTLENELRVLEAAQADAEAALADLRSHYRDGVLTAPADGSVDADVPSPGDVFRPGDEILSVYSGEAYVLAYLPRRYLFDLEPGMPVEVSNGRLTAAGEIEAILPVTGAAPAEFQNTFRPTDRNQLARIRLIEAADFPLREKVTIRAASRLPQLF